MRAVRERFAKGRLSRARETEKKREKEKKPGEVRSMETGINQSAHVESSGGLAGRSGASLGLIKLQIVSAHVHVVIRRVTRVTLSACISIRRPFTLV